MTTSTVRGMAPLFQVYDMPTSIRFYRDLLGFTVVAKYGFKGFSFRDPDGFDLCFHWPVG